MQDKQAWIALLRRHIMGAENATPIQSGEEREETMISEASRKAVERALAREPERDTREQAKTAAIRAWMNEHADAALLEQFDDGLLDRSEAITMVADYVFKSLDLGQPLFDKETDGVNCGSPGCGCGFSDEARTLPREVYAQAWLPVKRKLPAGSTWDFRKVTECIASKPYSSTEREAFYIANISVPYQDGSAFRFDYTIRLDAE